MASGKCTMQNDSPFPTPGPSRANPITFIREHQGRGDCYGPASSLQMWNPDGVKHCPLSIVHFALSIEE